MGAGRQHQASVRKNRVLRIIGICGAVCALMLAAMNAQATTVVTDTVVSQASQTQNNIPVTFGQVFKAGDVPHGATLTASLNGQPVTLQVDAKATNGDGSLRHAVLTVMVPWLSGSAKLPLVIGIRPAAAHAPAVSLEQLLATGFDSTVSFRIGGKNYTISARALLQAAANTRACGQWDPQCTVWLSGPLVSEWVVNGPVTASDGTVNPNLRVYFAVRAYAGSAPDTIGHVRTDIIVENSNAFASPAQPQYTATVTSGSASYTSPSLTQYSYTRWHKVLWWNDTEPQVYLQQDTKYIQASKAVSRYMDLKPGESFLAGLRQSCAPLHNCDQTKTMSNTGAQPAIGPLPRWTSVYIIDPDVRAYRWMLANDDALGAYSIHYRDEATGWPVSIQRHPYVTKADWAYANGVAQHDNAKGRAYRADLLPACCKSSNPNVWDNAHQPAEAYVAYMVTGDYYYMEEVAFGASHNALFPNETYRGFSKGLIDSAYSQVRGKAWVLREMANAAYILPDDYPLKAEFRADVENSLDDWNKKYTNNPNANPLHVMKDGAVYTVHGAMHNGSAPWQHNFLTWSAGHAAELGFAGATEFRNWLAKFEIGLMTDWQSNPASGYCWLEASAYSIQVKDASGKWLPSYSAVWTATFPGLAGLACNSPDMLEKLKNMAGEMEGYAYSATGYPANLQIGLAAAADSGLANAMDAWSLFDSRSVKPSGSTSYDNYPNFAVIPRSATGSTPLPPTSPPASTIDTPTPVRNIMLPVAAQNAQPASQSAQPAVRSARLVGPQATQNSAAAPARSGWLARTEAGRMLTRIAAVLRSELPSFKPARVRHPLPAGSANTSRLADPLVSEAPRGAAQSVQRTATPTTYYSQSASQNVEPSAVRKKIRHTTASAVGRGSLRQYDLSCHAASTVASAACAQR
jgi:hypothetical protein